MDIGTRAVVWAEKNWGRPISPGEIETIIAWCDDFFSRGSPSPDDVVIEALNECDAAGPDARNKRYLGGILVKWLEAGVITVIKQKHPVLNINVKAKKSTREKIKIQGTSLRIRQSRGSMKISICEGWVQQIIRTHLLVNTWNTCSRRYTFTFWTDIFSILGCRKDIQF